MTGERIQEPPVWQQSVEGLLRIIESDMTAPDFHVEGANNLIGGLLKKGLLPDLGTLEEYLGERDACLRLVAVPMDSPSAPPDAISLDPRDGTTKTHGMMVLASWDKDWIRSVFADFVTDPTDNISLLREHTGLVRPDGEIDTMPQTLEEAMATLEQRIHVLMERSAEPTQILGLTNQALIGMIRDGLAADLGTIQEYQRAREDSLFDITYRPATELRIRGARALDIVSGEERPYYFIVSFGSHRLFITDHEANITRLRHETGVASV